jgi:hypothetical protein
LNLLSETHAISQVLRLCVGLLITLLSAAPGLVCQLSRTYATGTSAL